MRTALSPSNIPLPSLLLFHCCLLLLLLLLLLFGPVWFILSVINVVCATCDWRLLDSVTSSLWVCDSLSLSPCVYLCMCVCLSYVRVLR